MASGGKTTTKTSVPDWITTPTQGLLSGITAAGSVDPQSRIAGTNPLLDAAQSYYTGGISPEAMDLIKSGAGGGGSVGHYKASDFMKDYENPYKDQVLKATLEDFDAEAGRQRAMADLKMGGNGGFYGSGGAITKSLLEGELGRARASTESGILADAFDKAAGLGSADANRLTQADTTNAQIGESAAARRLQAGMGLAGLQGDIAGKQFLMGDYLRGVEGERLNADFTNLGKQASLFGALPLNLWQTQTQSHKPGALDYLSTGAGIASMFFSDERLKTDIERVGTRPDGLGLYLYRYVWSPIRYLGVMAQEVLKVRPDAVAVHPSGFLMVDYARL